MAPGTFARPDASLGAHRQTSDGSDVAPYCSLYRTWVTI
jgi:hypothetical protein